MAKAHISSPEVLRTFREKFVKFDDDSKQALSSVSGDVSRVIEWLRREQKAYWKQQLRKREELVQSLRLEYNRAIQGDKYQGKSSGVDERKRLDKALRMKAEAEQKIESVKRWSITIESKAGKLLMPCTSLATQLEVMTPKMLARLDQMMESLEDYLRLSSSTPPLGGSSE